MAGAIISAIGIFITGIGTFIRAVPDLDRPIRHHFYKNAPKTRELFESRSHIKEIGKERTYTLTNRRVSRELIDYVDSNALEDPPDRTPERLITDATQIKVEYPNGDTDYFIKGKIAHRTFIELLTLSIEKRCRNYGLLIAVIGTGLAISGTILPA